MPGTQRQFIAQAGHQPPGPPTRKLPSNMWDSTFMAYNEHLLSNWTTQLPEMASRQLHNPLRADPITTTNGLLLRLESARTGSLTSMDLDTANSAYTGSPASLHNGSSRLPVQPCYKIVPSTAQLPPIIERSFVGRQTYITHRSACLAHPPIIHPPCLFACLLNLIMQHRLQHPSFVRCRCPGELEGSLR